MTRRFPRPWRRPGRVILIQDITRSDRDRLPDWEEPDWQSKARRVGWFLILWTIALLVVVTVLIGG